MVIEVTKNTSKEDLEKILSKLNSKKYPASKPPFDPSKFSGKLKGGIWDGIDGMEFQKLVRNDG